MFTAGASSRIKSTVWLAFLFVLGLAAWLRFTNLGKESLMIDESTYAWWLVTLPVDKMLDALRQVGSNPPFYFLILKAYAQLFGESEFALRSLSAVVDLASVGLAFWLGWRLGRLSGALACSLFWALHPALVWNARVARPYAFVTTLSLCLLCLFLLQLEKGSKMRWALMCLLISIGLVSQFFFFLIAAALLAWTVLRIRQDSSFFRSYSSVFILGLAPVAVWIYWFFQIDTPLIGTGWIRAPSITDFGLTLWNLISGYAGVFSITSLLFGCTALVMVGLGIATARPRGLAVAALVCGIILPVTAVWVLSQRRPLYVDRYFFPLYPFLALLIAFAGAEFGKQAQTIEASRIRNILTLAGLGALFVGIWNGWQVHIDPKYSIEDWRGVAAYLSDQGVDGLPLWLPEPEAEVAIGYYHPVQKDSLIYSAKPVCPDSCYWVLRQPYTMTHAYAQGVSDPGRPWRPDLPANCQLLDRWDSPSGVAAWKVHCQ
jgi:4-amino-4-deoxy-L-arabinose transferase-like glycosyltransferase